MNDAPHSIAAADLALADACALELREGFAEYNARFRAITQRAQRHFESGDHRAGLADTVARMELYEVCVAATVRRLSQRLDLRTTDRELWRTIRERFELAIADL